MIPVFALNDILILFITKTILYINKIKSIVLPQKYEELFVMLLRLKEFYGFNKKFIKFYSLSSVKVKYTNVAFLPLNNLFK